MKKLQTENEELKTKVNELTQYSNEERCDHTWYKQCEG